MVQGFDSFFSFGSLGGFGNTFPNLNLNSANNTNVGANASVFSNPLNTNAINPFFNFNNCFDNDFGMSNFDMPFSDAASFSAFSTDFSMFNMMMNGLLSQDYMANGFNQSFNTQNNLEALQSVYNPDLSNNLANIASNTANKENTVGYCAAGVVDSLEAAGLAAEGEDRVEAAYEAADKLRGSKNFKEVSVTREDLSNLPAGCVVVWDASDGHPYGHITITLGKDENGTPQEASDHVQELITDRDAKFSVFVPVASNS